MRTLQVLLACFGVCGLLSNGKAQQVFVQRAYMTTSIGQIHYRVAIPTNGTEKVPLVCFHQSPGAGHVFDSLMALVGTQKIVYAPDTPGFGYSDAMPSQPDIANYASVFADFIAKLGFKQVDILGYHTGGLIGVELAAQYQHLVRKLSIVGLAVFNDHERHNFSKTPWPRPINEDGSHLTEEWKRSLNWKPPQMPIERLAEHFAYKLKAGQNAWWGARAALYYPTLVQLSKVKCPILIIRPKDDLWEVSLRAKNILPKARWVDLPTAGFWVFDTASLQIAEILSSF